MTRYENPSDDKYLKFGIAIGTIVGFIGIVAVIAYSFRVGIIILGVELTLGFLFFFAGLA